MDRFYACVRDGAVVEVKLVTDEIPFVDVGYDHVFDVTGSVPEVEAGWVYSGGELVAPESADVDSAAHAAGLVKMELRFKFGNALADRMIKILSVKNIELGKTSAQVNAMISAFLPIEMALRKCALPTALLGILAMEAGYSEYGEEFQVAKTALEQFISSELPE